MKIARSEAVKVFMSLDLRNAGKWNSGRMAQKLAKIKTMVDEDVIEQLDEDDATALKKVMDAAEAGETFEVVDDKPVEEKKPPVEEKPAKGRRAKKQQEAKEEKPAEKAAEEKPTEETTSESGIGTRQMRDRVTNGFVGGQIFAEVGPTDEVTPEMVARFDELKGRETRSSRSTG